MGCEIPAPSEPLGLCLRCVVKQKVLAPNPGKREARGVEEAVPSFTAF